MSKYIFDNHALLDTKEGVLKSGFQVLVGDNRGIEITKGTMVGTSKCSHFALFKLARFGHQTKRQVGITTLSYGNRFRIVFVQTRASLLLVLNGWYDRASTWHRELL